MTSISFKIEYGTRAGECVRVDLQIVRRAGTPLRRAVMLETADGVCWAGTVSVAERDVVAFSYAYEIVCSDTVVRREWEAVPRSFPAVGERSYVLHDWWRDVPEANPFFSSAYQFCTHLSWQSVGLVYYGRTLVLRVLAPQLSAGQTLAVVGNQPPLGTWRPERALRMSRGGLHEWFISLSADGLYLPFEYKYVVLDESGRLVSWEDGDNRRSPSVSVRDGEVLALSDGVARLAMPDWRVAGVVVPVFSLRSEGSQGVGDFGDLRRFVSWAADAGMRMVQLLPVNDTTQTGTWTDSYPYNAISAFALHPIYCDLRQTTLRNSRKRALLLRKLSAENLKPTLDYEAVSALKEKWLRALFSQEQATLADDASFADFCRQQEEWLLPYAVFCALRDQSGTADSRQWPCLATYDEAQVRAYAAVHPDEVTYYSFVQYLLHRQLAAAADFARQHAVVLKGDIPIGVSPHSVETWQQPQLFHLDRQAGAPPDAFSADGQNWGFPTYDWERMAADGYRWWRRRLQRMARYFDAYRIDHVLGFFRIWSIPRNCENALLGQFDPSRALSEEEIAAYGLTCRTATGRRRPAVFELFVPDQHQPTLLHPRLGIQGTPAFRRLSKDEQAAFCHLSDDYFYRRNDELWYAEAMKKLPALMRATQMLVCAEDLGMVPACVRPVMDRLRILSLEIQSMPKGMGQRFARLEENPRLSVCTLFTHDMPTLRQWWQEDAERRQAYCEALFGRRDMAQAELSGAMAEEIIRRHLSSPSMLCLLSLQDWLATDEALRRPNAAEERINEPANSRHYWRYRMHLTLETLVSHTDFSERLRGIIVQSGRG
ncbi:MAG: 4-alpha-glucanotransferase [Bacteroidaceae bacterium]|nr:4-alpha-glucanotransferase [Bacteroidaceae bacterium]